MVLDPLAAALIAVEDNAELLRGPQGLKGDPGTAGRDSQVPGPRGLKGDPGKPGGDGKDGAYGKEGKQGKQGVKGDRGDRGEKGDRGEIGPAMYMGGGGGPSIFRDDVQLDVGSVNFAGAGFAVTVVNQVARVEALGGPGGPGTTVADILDLPTAEMDDLLVLAPDGAGGVGFRAEAPHVIPDGTITAAMLAPGAGGSMPALTIVRTGGTQPFPPVAVSGYQIDGVLSGSLVSAIFELPSDAVTLAFPNLAMVPVSIDPNVGVLAWVADDLTTLDLSALQALGTSFNPSFPSLATLDLSAMQILVPALDIQTPALETLILSALQIAYQDFNPVLPALTTIDISALQRVYLRFNPNLDVLETLDLSALQRVGNDFYPVMPALTTIDLTALQEVGGSFYPTFDILTTLDLSALQRVYGAFYPTMPALTTLNLPALRSIGSFILTGAALTQASVDGILVALAALDGTGGTTSLDGADINLSGGTSAAPSATGLAAIATLEGRGNVVVTNP